VRELIDQALEVFADVRLRKKREPAVVGYVRAFRPDVEPDEIAEQWARIEEWDKRRRADERLTAKLRTMTDTELRAAEKGAARRTRDAHTRGSPGEAWVHGRRGWFIAREWERREPLRNVLRETRQEALI
jgi:hypothetical protein